MFIAAAWGLLIMGIAHTVFGLVRFRQPIAEALRAGFIGQFMPFEDRLLAFWFTICGPLFVMAGLVALRAAKTADLELLKLIGFGLLLVSMMGALALPKSPFWVGLVLSLVFIGGVYGGRAS